MTLELFVVAFNHVRSVDAASYFTWKIIEGEHVDALERLDYLGILSAPLPVEVCQLILCSVLVSSSLDSLEVFSDFCTITDSALTADVSLHM